MARLVICDDETHITDILSRFFKERGHEVFGTTDAEAALQHALANRTDLVISDIAMRGIGGIDLLRRLKASGSEIPVIITTGNPSHSTAVNALREGAFDYLVKPFHLEEIAARADRALADKRVREENVLYSKLVSLHSISKAVAQAPTEEDLTAKVIRLGARLTQSNAGWYCTPASVSPAAESPELAAFLQSIAADTLARNTLSVTDSVDGLKGEEAWFLSLPVDARPVGEGVLIFRRWKPEGKYDPVDLEVLSQLSVTFALGLRALRAAPPRVRKTKSKHP